MSTRRQPRSTLLVLALATTVSLSLGSAVAWPASAAGSVTTSSAPSHAWPEMHHDQGLSGASADPLIGTTNASRLGVRWMADTGSPILGSPVVAWNQTLQRTVAYVTNEAGYLIAFDEADGSQLWSVAFGAPIRTTPLVDGGAVWVAPTYSHRLYKLNAATGKALCSAPLTVNADSSPVIATPSGGVRTVYEGVNDVPTANGPLTAVRASNCTTLFSAAPFPEIAGMWDPISYGVSASGRPLVLFGTADPDSAVYALDARTGALVWRFAINNPLGTQDVGAGVTVSLPGNNGFADGMAYVPGKDGYFYALDLTTGALVWQYDFGSDSGAVPPGTVSTPALSGNELVFGENSGAYALDATTGARLWHFAAAAVLSSPAVVGTAGQQVAVFGDLSGAIHVVSAATGQELYRYQTGDYVVSSPADVDGNLLIGSADSYLYDLAPGGGNDAAPTTVITGPGDGSSVPSHNGVVTVHGTATAPGSASHVSAVRVEVQRSGSSGQWWDGATGQWAAAPIGNPAVLTAPGAMSTSWSFDLPVPASGGAYRILASAVTSGGVADVAAEQAPPTSARANISVQPSASAPQVSVGNPWATPGVTVKLSGQGFAAGEPVDITMDGTSVGHGTANSQGVLPATSVAIPRSAPFGYASLLATGVRSSRAGTATVYVTNAWSQLGSGSQRNSFERNDPGFAQHLSIDPSQFLAQTWSFDSGAPISTSPVVVRDVAYFANDAGQLDAVDVLSGLQLWSSQADSGPVHSTPLVDSGLVVVGTHSGTVSAFDAVTGSPVWSADAGAAVDSSPTAANSRVYVTTRTGSLLAINEVNGHVIWSKPLGAPTTASPTVDAGVVVVGDDGGTVQARNAISGARVWGFQTGGAVTAPAAINAGTVYIGSTDGSLYALRESDGSSTWTFATGGAIHAGVTVGASVLAVGSDSGYVSFVDPATGTQVAHYNFHAPLVGLAHAPDFVVGEAASGRFEGIKPSGDNVQWLNQGPGALSTSPAIVNGAVYLTGRDGVLRVYTVPGVPVR